MSKEYEMTEEEKEKCDRELLEAAYSAMEGKIEGEDGVTVATAIIEAIAAMANKYSEIRKRIMKRERISDFYHHYTERDILGSAFYAHLSGADITDVDPYSDAGFMLRAFSSACVCVEAMERLESALDFEDGCSGEAARGLLKVMGQYKILSKLMGRKSG